jgi:AcrR family transcriptional regulator
VVAESDTKQRILHAARERLLADGFAALSTRKIADAAGVPLSQVHYHLGTRNEMVLRMLEAENDRLLERQAAMFSQATSLAEQWAIACDYLDDDLMSGYVRILQEMTAAGWSSDVIGEQLREMMAGWAGVLADVARRAQDSGIDLGGLTPEEVSALTSALFIGAESLILTGMERDGLPLRAALRKVGRLIGILGSGTRVEDAG